MKAQVLHSICDLRYEEVPEPVLRSGEVMIGVRAAGICGSDVPRVYETGAHKMPLIPGHEFSGVVESVGEGADHAWTGKRVGVFPLIPCGKCEQCRQGHYELCRSYDYTGSRRDGAFAERVAVPASNLIELPENVSFEEAAMLEPMSVAVHAMRRGFRAAGIPDVTGPAGTELAEKTVAIIGAGTIGLLLAMFLKDAGARKLFIIGNKDTQKKRAAVVTGVEKTLPEGKPQDAAGFINTMETDPVEQLCSRTGGGADLVFECVGKAETCSTAVECAAPMGTVVLMGNPYGEMTLSRNTYWKVLRNQLTLTGTWNSSFDVTAEGDAPQIRPVSGTARDDWRYVLERLQKNAVRPSGLITHRLPLAELERGLLIMRDKTEDYCKVMVGSMER